jgi:hypothetical protein
VIFEFVEVVKTAENYHYIEWQMDQNYPADNYMFEIYWSNDALSQFTAILDGSTNLAITIDGSVGPLVYTHQRFQYDFNQNFFYKIKAILKTDISKSFYSNVVFAGDGSDGIHKTIVFNEDTLNKNYIGEPCKILKRKTHGTRCTECWDQYRRQITKSHCPTCNGTGFLVGYYSPIIAQLGVDSDPKKNDPQQVGEDPTTIKRSRLPNYPMVRDKDLIITTDDNKRYKIINVETTKLPRMSSSSRVLSRQNFILSQLITMEEIISSDQEYAIDT